MSIEAMTWAMNLAPVPAAGSKRGKPNPAAAAVLIGIANHASPDGSGAFPSVRTLMRYTRLSERTVRSAVDLLADARIILPGDPAIAAAYIKRGDLQPEVWNLDMSLLRDDLSTEELWDVARKNPFLEPLIHRALTRRNSNGVREMHPVPGENHIGVREMHPVPVDNPERGARNAPRDPERGAALAERGARSAPEPDLKQEENPPPPTSSAVDNPQEAGGSPEHGTAEQLAALALASLPAPWHLDAGTRRRALPKLAARIATGWTLPALRSELTHSPEGVRKPGGVFMARLDALPTEPPHPPGSPSPPIATQKCTQPGHEHYELPCRGCVVDAKAAS